MCYQLITLKCSSTFITMTRTSVIYISHINTLNELQIKKRIKNNKKKQQWVFVFKLVLKTITFIDEILIFIFFKEINQSIKNSTLNKSSVLKDLIFFG